MLQYSTILQPTMMKEQQQECSDIHTIQIFREAPSCMQTLSFNQVFQESPNTSTTNTLRLNPQAEVTYGIGGDQMELVAIEMDEDVSEIEQPSTAFDRTEHSQEGESSLYSFYFETPIVSMAQDSSSDDYTITSHDTESFHNNNDLNLVGIDDIWEQGLDHSSSMDVETRIPKSNPSPLIDGYIKDKGR
jgi:hypothetical protein